MLNYVSSQSLMWLSNGRLCDMCVCVWEKEREEVTLMNNKTDGGWLMRV